MKKLLVAGLAFSAVAVFPGMQATATAALAASFADPFNSLSYTMANWTIFLPNWEAQGLQADMETYSGIRGTGDVTTGLAGAVATGVGALSTANLFLQADFKVHQLEGNDDGGGMFFAVDPTPDNVYITGLSLKDNLLYARTLSNSVSFVSPVSGLAYDTTYRLSVAAGGNKMNLFLQDMDSNFLAAITDVPIATLGGVVGIYGMDDATFSGFLASGETYVAPPPSVPVPPAFLLAGSGLLGLIGFRSRKQQAD